MSTHQKKKLRRNDAPKVGAVVTAPPILIASTHTVDYTCAYCDTVLMHAEDGQVHSLIIHCTRCGYNATQ
jgi:hypothetical protein